MLKTIKKHLLTLYYAVLGTSYEEEIFNQQIIASDKNGAAEMQAEIDGIISQKPFPLFKYINIETFNKCNNICEFCAGNIHHDTREHVKMSNEMFYSIIKQLKDLDYSGSIAFSAANEPLLDNRIYDFIDFARKELPNAYFKLVTNGILINMEKFLKLLPNLDFFYIDNYHPSKNPEIIPQIKPIIEYCLDHPEINQKVMIAPVYLKAIRNNFAGYSPNRKKTITLSANCHLPFTQLNIRANGQIALCCNDILCKLPIGNINNSTLLETWRDERRIKIQDLLKNKGRKAIKYCSKCDAYNPVKMNDMQKSDFEYLNSLPIKIK